MKDEIKVYQKFIRLRWKNHLSKTHVIDAKSRQKLTAIKAKVAYKQLSHTNTLAFRLSTAKNVKLLVQS